MVRYVLRGLCTLSSAFHSHVLFSLGSRPAVSPGQRGEKPEHWRMVLGRDLGPRESLSARQRGGKFLIKAVWLKEKGKNQNHVRNVGNSQGWERRPRRWRERTLENRQAANRLWKAEGASAIQTMANTWPMVCPFAADRELLCSLRVRVYAEQLKRKTEDQTNQCLRIHNKFLSIYLFIFSWATKEATANLQGAVVARGWIMAILIWLCKSSEEPKARYRNIS